MLPAGGNTTDYKSPSFLAIDNYGRRPNLRYKPTSSKFLRIAHTYTIQIPSYGSYNHRNRNIRCPYKPAYVSNRRKCDRSLALSRRYPLRLPNSAFHLLSYKYLSKEYFPVLPGRYDGYRYSNKFPRHWQPMIVYVVISGNNTSRARDGYSRIYYYR